MDMARNELKKTQDLLKMLTDSKTVLLHQSSSPLNTAITVVMSRCSRNGMFDLTRASTCLNLPPELTTIHGLLLAF